jgi:ATP-dependent helicase/DNAse subunit B
VPITLITGPANAGKAREVMSAVGRYVAHGVQPLLVLPTRADVEHYRRELAQEGLVLGARVERFAGLIGEVVRRAGIGEAVLGRVAREQMLTAIASSAVAAEGEVPAATSRELSTPGFVRALMRIIEELEIQRVTPARFEAALRAWVAVDGTGAVESAQELERCFSEYRRTLKRIRRTDREQRAVQALDALRRERSLWGATPVLMYGFDDFGALQLDAIETLGVVVDAPVTVSLTYEPGRTAFAGRAGTFETLAPLVAEHRRLQARAEYYAPPARAALHHLERPLFEPGPTRVAAGGTVRLLEGGGERAELELVASEVRTLLNGGMKPEEIAVVHRSPGVVADLLGEVFGAAKVPYGLERQTPFANTATGGALVGALRCATDGGEARDLLTWLRAPGLLERPELADRLEARVRREGVQSATGARALWEEEHWSLEALDRMREAAERGGVALIERATRELEWLFAAPRRGMAAMLESDERDEASALAAAQRALGELNKLAHAAPELGVDAAGLARVLGRLEIVSGEREAPGTVAVVDPLALRARRVRALFLCGLQEGVFPASPRPEPLLAEEERRRLAETSGLRLGSRYADALAVERYLLYAAISRPEELLVLSWHAASDDGVSSPRSLFVDDVADLFEDGLQELQRRRPLGSIGWSVPGESMPALEMESGTASSRLGPLREEELRGELQEHTWSASSLEVWASCPVKWFVQRLLRAEDLDPDPEPLARGALAHAVLKDTLEGLREQAGSAKLTPARLGLARKLLREALERRAREFPLSAAEERRPGLRRRLEADLERYLEHAAECESPLEPTYLELGFGFVEEDGLPALDLGEGLRLRGRIDRVDVDAEGREAVLYDYKGRNAPPAAKWVEQGNMQVALYMRAVEELLGLEVAGGFYQPLSGADLRARGVLDGESTVQIECVRGEVRGRAEVAELLVQAVAQAREAAVQAGRGELEPRPRTCAYRGGCMYPTICRCES